MPQGSLSSADLTPRERSTHYRTIATGHDESEGLQLARGQYRVQYTIPYDGEPQRIRNTTKALDTGDEYKRVHFYKMDVHPLDEPDPETGEPVARVTAVFHVLDNVIPLAPLVWAGSAAIIGGTGWLFLDKVETVSERAPIAFVPILAAIGTIYFLVRGNA